MKRLWQVFEGAGKRQTNLRVRSRKLLTLHRCFSVYFNSSAPPSSGFSLHVPPISGPHDRYMSDETWGYAHGFFIFGRGDAGRVQVVGRDGGLLRHADVDRGHLLLGGTKPRGCSSCQS